MARVSRRKIAQYIAAELAAGMDARMLMQQAASYLLEHRMTSQSELLVRDIEAILARDHGVVMARVTSARALSNELLQKIEQYVANSQGASKVEVSTSIDPSLLGGVVIKTPSAELDTSVRKQLNALKA